MFSRARGGTVSFFKDGYTDIRGVFEYAQTNANKLQNIEKFAIFIMSDELGTLARTHFNRFAH